MFDCLIEVNPFEITNVQAPVSVQNLRPPETEARFWNSLCAMLMLLEAFQMFDSGEYMIVFFSPYDLQANVLREIEIGNGPRVNRQLC